MVFESAERAGDLVAVRGHFLDITHLPNAIGALNQLSPERVGIFSGAGTVGSWGRVMILN